jgi:hypothetical protein
MKTDLSWELLHDATLVGIEMAWDSGDVVVHLRTGLSPFPHVQIKGISVRRIECPRNHPWGPSVSVNTVRGPSRTTDGAANRIEIEMQSGDTLIVEATAFELLAQPVGASNMSSPTWGDTVRIKNHASPGMRPGSLAAVCGMREVETDAQAKQFGCAVGTPLYLIEFGDGSSVEIPETFVELANEDDG